MAEGRMLKRKITQSKKMAALKTDKARLLWLYLLPFTDVDGRIEADTEDIRENILRMQRKGYSVSTIQTCLEDLHDVGLITLYTVESQQYLEYTKFGKEQKLRRDKEAESTIPDPDTGQVRDRARLAPLIFKGSLKEEKRSKGEYAEFVFLTEDEYKKLIAKFGEKLTKEKIEELNNGIGSKGYKYNSHYHTILTWDRKHAKDNKKTTEPDKTCIVCKKPGRDHKKDANSKKIWLCELCLMGFHAMGKSTWGYMPKSEIEKMVQQGKAKLRH